MPAAVPRQGDPVLTDSPRAPRVPRRSLRRALASLMLSFAVVPAVAGALLISLGGAWLLQGEVYHRMQSMADGICSELQMICADTLTDLDRFAQRNGLRADVAALVSPSVSAPERERRRAATVRQLAQLGDVVRVPGGAAVVVALQTGRPVAWEGCTAEHAADIASHHLLGGSLAAAAAWLTPAHLDPTTRLPVVTAVEAIPLPIGQTGRPQAAIIWHVPLSHRIYPALAQRRGLGRTGEVVFVDRTGLALRDVRYERGSAFSKVIQAAPARRAIAGRRETRVQRDYRGVPVVAATGHVPMTGWGIVAKQDAAEALGGLLYLGLIWLAFLALLLLGAIGAARRLSRRFLRPVEELVQATHRVAAGELAVAIPRHRDDELGALVADFNAMAVEVAAAREAVHASEERLRMALEAANEGLWDWDLQSGHMYLSPRCHALLGYTPDEIEPSLDGVIRLVHPDEADMVREAIKAHLSGATEHYHVEVRVRTADSQWRWILLRGRIAERDEAGQPRRFSGTVMDIDSRKQAETALAESEARYRAIGELMPHGTFMMDARGHYLYLSPSFLELIGKTLDDMNQPGAWRLLQHPDDVAESQRLWHAAQAQHTLYVREYRALGADGQYHWILCRGVPAFDDAGELQYWVGVNLAFDETKTAAEALRLSEERLQTAIEAANEVLWDWYVPSDSLYVSPRLQQILGYGPEKIPTTMAGILELLHPDDVPGALEAIQLQSGPETVTGAIEARVRTGDDQWRWLMIRGQATERDAAGAPVRLAGTVADISERKAAEAALAESELRYRTIGELMPHGTFMVGRDGSQLHLSQSFLDLIGMDMETVQQTDSESLIHPDDIPSSRQAWRVAMATRSFFANEYRVRGADGQYHWVLSRGVPVLDEAGEVDHWVGVNIDVADLKAAQADLGESEARYRSLFENMLNGFALHEMVFDAAGQPVDYRFLELNAAFEGMTGLSRAQAVGRTALELLPGLEPDWIDRYGRVALTGQPDRFEHFAAPLDRWFSVLAFCPRPGQFAAIFEDVTARRRAEQAETEVRARLQAVIASSPVAIYVMDLAAGVQLWNPAAERLFGWPEAEVLGARRVPIVQEEAGAEYARAVSDVLLQGRMLQGLETVRIHRDGSPVPVSISSAPLFAADGSVSGWVSVLADLRERLRAEHEFEERAALDKLVQVTHKLLAEATPEGLLEQAANGARELLGADLCKVAHDYRDGAFRFVVLSSSAPAMDCADVNMAKAANRGMYLGLLTRESTVRLSAEEFARHPVAAGLPADHLALRGFLGASLMGEGADPTGLIMLSDKHEGDFTARDEALLHQLATFTSLALARLEALAELESQARALAASNRELEAFSYSVSHDLRAPLRAIDGFSQALEDEYGDRLDNQARHYLQRVRNGSQRLGELIDDLLQLSRVSRDPMRWEPVDLSVLAEEIVSELRAAEPERVVTVSIREGLLVQGHPTLLRAMLLNLLGNAWKFTGRRAGAHIEFGQEWQGEGPVFFVRDDGAGFDMRYADKLFVPFQRLHAEAEFPGNGVGLATVQRVVSRHGGQAWAESVVGEGATFYFTLGK